MKNQLFILILLLFTTSFLKAQNLLVAYYASWNQEAFTADEIRYNLLTHIIHAFVWPEADGSLGYDSGFFYPALNTATHQNGKKILLSVGGATQSYNFSSVTADSAKRTKLTNEIISTLNQYHYDGVDIDWEFPESEADKNNLVTFIAKLNSALNKANPDYLLTLAIPSGDYYGQWFRYDVLKMYADWFNVMTYDYHGSWTNHSGHNAPLYPSPQDACGSVDETLTYLRETRAIDADELCLGLPFYGRKFNCNGLYRRSTGGDETYGYKDIISLVGNGWAFNWDDVCKVPYLTNNAGNQLLTYDDTTSIRLKSNYILDKKLKGGMIWALGHDQLENNRQPLLETASSILRITSILKSGFQNMSPCAIQLSAFPNPFNNEIKIVYFLPAPGLFRLEIFGISGQKIISLKNKYGAQGWHQTQWHAGRYASGNYVVTLKQNNHFTVQNLVLIK